MSRLLLRMADSTTPKPLDKCIKLEIGEDCCLSALGMNKNAYNWTIRPIQRQENIIHFSQDGHRPSKSPRTACQFRKYHQNSTHKLEDQTIRRCPLEAFHDQEFIGATRGDETLNHVDFAGEEEFCHCALLLVGRWKQEFSKDDYDRSLHPWCRAAGNQPHVHFKLECFSRLCWQHDIPASVRIEGEYPYITQHTRSTFRSAPSTQSDYSHSYLATEDEMS